MKYCGEFRYKIISYKVRPLFFRSLNKKKRGGQGPPPELLSYNHFHLAQSMTGLYFQ